MAGRFLDFILRHPVLVTFAILALTVPSAVAVYNSEFSPSIVESFVDDPRDYQRAKALEDLFPRNPDALVWLATTEGDSLLTLETLRAIRQAAAEIEALEDVVQVIALPDAPRPRSAMRGIRSTTQKAILNLKLKQGQVPEEIPQVRRVLPPNGRMRESEWQQLSSQLKSSTGLASSLLSKDQRSQVMLIELANPGQLAPDRQIEFAENLERIVRDSGLGEQGYYYSGLIPLQAHAFIEIGRVLQTMLPAGLFLISLAVIMVFRRFEVLLVTIVIALISVAWGVGLGVLIYGKFSVLMVAVPLMVLVISTADVIHLVSSYTTDMLNGFRHEAAIRKTFLEVGGACVLTSITTFVGFASLIVVPSRTIRQFGFAAAAGVASALLLSVIFVPLLLNALSRWGRPVTAPETASRLTQRISQLCLSVSLRFPKLIVTLFILILGIAGWYSSHITLDPDLAHRFSASHPMRASTEFFTEQFGGVNTAEILLQGSPDELLSPENIATIKEFSEQSEALGFGAAASIDDVLTGFLQEVDYKNTEGRPLSALHAEAALKYLRNMESDLVDSLITPDHSTLRLLIKIPATSYLKMAEHAQQLSDLARSTFPAEIKVQQKGSAPVIGTAVREIIVGHMQGFGLCFSTIFVLIAFGLRSLPLAWTSVLPNVSPLFILGALVAIFDPVADSDILAVATLGLGLAVDDTIHFLSRFQLERKDKSVREALAAAMDHTGLAIIRTTLILSVGFLPFALSNYSSINMLGTYLIAVLLTAVLADLIFLPAFCILVFGRSRTDPK